MRDPARAGDPAVYWTLLPHRGVVSVTGEDRRPFLQGLISQDVDKVDAGRATFGALLTPQGKFLHDFCIVAWQDAILLDGERDRVADLVQRLMRFRLRAKIEVTDRSDEFKVMAVFALAAGASPHAPLELPVTEGAARTLGAPIDGVAFTDPRLAALGVRVIARGADDLATQLGLAPADPETFDRRRLALGVPDGARDLEVEKSTLLEANFDALNGIDWEKGCFMGQELTARTRYRGLVKRRLVPITFDGPPPAAGAVVEADGATVGSVRSAVAGHGLANLRVEALGRSDLRTDGRPIAVVVPDWLRPFTEPATA